MGDESGRGQWVGKKTFLLFGLAVVQGFCSEHESHLQCSYFTGKHSIELIFNKYKQAVRERRFLLLKYYRMKNNKC